VAAKIAATEKEPEIGDVPDCSVELPVGYITAGGVLVRDALVRELDGYAEEKLSRLDPQKNMGVFVTELLTIGVERLGDETVNQDLMRRLLIGDRDALMLGIRKATYGNDVEFTLRCAMCDKESKITVFLDSDVKVDTLEDPLKRVFEVELRHGRIAEVGLLTGLAQEAWSENMMRRTSAELNTIMLAKSVIKVDGVLAYGREEIVQSMPSGDRAILVDFLNAHQPGPKFQEIPVNCATCGEEYPISLGLPSLFRL